MARAKAIVLCILLFSVFAGALMAGDYAMKDGQVVSGEPVSYDKDGVVFRQDYKKRFPWSQFTQEALKQLANEAKRPQDRAHVEPHLEEVAIEKEKRKAITINPPPRVSRPEKTGFGAMFRSPLGLLIFVLLYAANIYAAYEIAFFRYRQPIVPCLVAAVLPIIGPLIFLFLPGPNLAAVQHQNPVDEAEAALIADEDTIPVDETQTEAEAGHHHHHPAAAALPATITFKRGEVMFNRRFFETKLAGFLKAVPTEADRDLVVYVNSARGEYVARRLAKVSPTDLHVLTFKGEATAEEVIPFAEIYEVQIRHKDMV